MILGGLISEGSYIRGGLYLRGLISGIWRKRFETNKLNSYTSADQNRYSLISEGRISKGPYIQEGLYLRGLEIRRGLYLRGLISEGAYNRKIEKAL